MRDFTERQIEIMVAATNRIDQYGIQNLTTKTLAADIGLSEPALYRHFKSKNDILLSLLEYFRQEMQSRVSGLVFPKEASAVEQLRKIFESQLTTFAKKPAIVSVIFAESIFHYDESLSNKVTEIMNLMHGIVKSNIELGQEGGVYSKLLNAGTTTTIITGGMRMAVMKWKLSGNKSDVVKDGMLVLNGILKMIEKK